MFNTWESLVVLAVLWVACGLVALDAWNDRAPRKPWEWKRPELEWWAVRRTKREQHNGAIRLPR